MPGPVVFVHAHPDDEAIFTGGTMALLAADGVEVVLVVATGGELGLTGNGNGDARALAATRRAEAEEAARVLGVHRIEHLGYRDSGMAGDPANSAPGAFYAAPVSEAAARLATILQSLRPQALVAYDDHGIYDHPDHVQVTRVARAASALAGVPVTYGATVDREYLHFVETHLVAEAGMVGDLGLVRSRLGMSSVEVATTVDVRSTLAAKRAAIAAHRSQIHESSSVLAMPPEHFETVYGLEWFVRWGPSGVLDALAEQRRRRRPWTAPDARSKIPAG